MFSRLVRDERGSILIYFTIMTAVLFGLIGLALDGARFVMLNSELQNLADGAALAGAKELDGGTDARIRAEDKARTLLTNLARWSDTVVPGDKIASVMFYSSLNPDTVATSDANAVYIKVDTEAGGVIPTFLQAVGATSTANTGATAMASSSYVACNVQPLMLCNPTYPNQFTASPGNIFGFTAGGNTGSMSPGVFSLLDPPGSTSSGAPDVKKQLAANSPKFCYIDNVSPRTGQAAGPVADGINVRFDMKPNGNTNGLDLTPDVNTIRGDDKNACTKQVNKLAADHALPVNAAASMTKVGSTWMGGSMDAGGASSYWSYHHSGAWPAGKTRYQVYQEELRGTYLFNSGTEKMSMAPNTCTNVAPAPNRRLISVAIVDCNEQNIHGNSTVNVRSNRYADFFILRPVDSDGIIWTEFVRFMTPQSDGSKLHHVVQLVR